MVFARTVISIDTVIGNHVHINFGCTVSHDVVLGDYVTLSPGVHLAGHVTVEPGVFLGIGASVVNGTSDQPLLVGRDAKIAASACIIRDVEPGAFMAGVPAARKN